MIKPLLGAVAVVLTFAGFVPYIRSILSGGTKPHVFSWIIWGAATVIVFAAQLSDGGGLGAWPIGLSGVITLYVAWLAFRRVGEIKVTRADWVFFTMALASLPLWYFTRDALWAVVILTAVDTLGFAPTVRKTYADPFHENLSIYAFTAVRNLVSAAALERYTWTTLFFPVVVSAACGLLIAFVLARRSVLSRPAG